MSLAIVLDAGSTGSRMSIYKFVYRDGSFQLENQTYDQLLPGLSAYADKPWEGAESLRPLLDKALNYVPNSQRHLTTISLKATAGLRSLPTDQQLRLLEEVRSLFVQYPFVMNGRSVEILDGALEGIYSWITAAFLLGESLLSSNIATLDLGGASLQITCLPAMYNATDAPHDHIHSVTMPGGGRVKIKSNSYRNAGLLIGRQSMLNKSKSFQVNHQTFDVISKSRQSNIYGSEGNSRLKSLNWMKLGDLSNSSALFDFQQWYNVAKSVISELTIMQIKELEHREIYLMSYFFDVALEAHLIPETDNAKQLRLKDFLDRARIECRNRADNSLKNDLLCLDLTFVYSLLHDGFRIPDDSAIWVVRTIHQTDVSWTLGAALSALYT